MRVEYVVKSLRRLESWIFAFPRCVVSSSNQFITWEGEAPAEPMRCQLGRSLALPNEDSAGKFKSAARLALTPTWIPTRKLQLGSISRYVWRVFFQLGIENR